MTEGLEVLSGKVSKDEEVPASILEQSRLDCSCGMLVFGLEGVSGVQVPMLEGC